MRDGNNSPKYLFFFLLLVSFIFIIIPFSSLVYSVKLAFSYSLNPHIFFLRKYEKKLADLPKNIKHLIEADTRLREMTENLKRSQVNFSRLDYLEQENSRLRKLLSLSAAAPGKGTFAFVISKNPGSGYSGFFVDKGEKDGIKEGFAVLAACGDSFALAGRIDEVYPGYSKAVSIINPDFSFMAYGGKDSVEGLCKGRESEGLILDYIPSKFEFLIGDPIYTSLSSLTFPAGLPVGKVYDILKKDSAMNFYQIKVRPHCDPEKIKEVYVMEYYSPLRTAEN